jgi:hypothetical protein
VDSRQQNQGRTKVEARLKKLERLNRVLFAGLALALLPWVIAAAEKVPQLIEGTNGKFEKMEAQQVVLIDDAGKQVGGLTGKKDASNLTIKDSNGKSRIFIGMSRGNPSLLFANKNGNVVASFVEQNGAFVTDQGQ